MIDHMSQPVLGSIDLMPLMERSVAAAEHTDRDAAVPDKGYMAIDLVAVDSHTKNEAGVEVRGLDSCLSQ